LLVYKHYYFNLSAADTVSRRVSFASYPALLSSEDDFYILTSQLVVMETTNSVFNLSLYDAITPSTVVSWIRAIVANRMANSGKEWVSIMKKYNSGTYNNQWIVVDYKLFKAGQQVLSPGTVWIGSQLPGYWEDADVTSVINQQGYWPSYNIPYFKDIFVMAGYNEMVKRYGNYWTYNGYPRAQIFKQRQGQVDDLQSLQTLMRYNDWQNDPLALGCPVNMIACRADLTPGNGTAACPSGAFGAVNGKITSSSMVPSFQASIIGGPTHDTQPVFEWTEQVSEKFWQTKHYGQPETFDFDWFNVQPEL